MRYIDTGGQVVPKHCIYGPRPAEGIVLDNYEWWSITDHLVREQRERELAAVHKAKEDAKKDISFDMTRNWTNTLASIKTQGDQKRMEKMEKEKRDKIEQYEQILKARREEKKEVVEGVRKVLFRDKDDARTINSGVLLSLVLEGRQQQIELKNRLRAEEAKKEVELGAKYRKDAEEFAEEKLRHGIEGRAKKNLQRQYLDEQMAEIKAAKSAEAEELKAEKQDMINMRIEEEKIEHCNMVERKYRKDFAAKYIQKTQNQLDYERNLVLEQEEEDEINRIYAEYDRRFKRERKAREEKIRDEKVEQRTKIAEMLAKGLGEAARAEDERLGNAAREKEAEALREQESKERVRKNALADVLRSKRAAEERRERDRHETKEVKKWEMMQAYKRAEINREWAEGERRRKRERQAETRAGYDEQCRELEERRAKELREEQALLEDSVRDREDILGYCQEAMDFAVEHNLPSYPIRMAISKVKKANGVWEEKEARQEGESPAGGSTEKKPKQAPLRTGCYCFKY